MSQAVLPGHLGEIFSEKSEQLLHLFRAAEENASLLQSDCYTVRDWLAIAGYQHDSLHVLLLLLMVAQDEGSLCIELSAEGLSRRLRDLVVPDEASAWAERLLADLHEHDFSQLIGSDPDQNRPVIHHMADGRRYLYFQKCLRHERDFARIFRARLTSAECAYGPQTALLRAVLEEEPLRAGGKPLAADAAQRRALELALVRPLVLISGGPGTGKTSIVLNILRCLIRSGVTADRIALAAPTGRAAQRLSDAIRTGLGTLSPAADSPDAALRDVSATTLHQLLDYYPARDQFRRHGENPLPADVVIVDEVSMVGMAVMAHLFQALPSEARLILLGDKDQLASVDAGAVLAHLIPEETADGPDANALRQALVMLETNHRSDTQIRKVAAAVNEQQEHILDALELLATPEQADTTWAHFRGERGVRLLEQTHQDAAELRRMLQCWAEYAYIATGFKDALAGCQPVSADGDDPAQRKRLEELFRLLDQTRLLTLLRDGPWGCVETNHFLAQTLRPRLDRPGRGSLFAGAPVLITRNDHVRHLYNGDVGLTLRAADGSLRVYFQRQGAFPSFPVEALPAHELGFALTVHKSQGSEYGQVFLVFPPTGGRRLLTKELVYTGITRARELVILCATREVLRLAIQKKCVRESGILRFV